MFLSQRRHFSPPGGSLSSAAKDRGLSRDPATLRKTGRTSRELRSRLKASVHPGNPGEASPIYAGVASER